jgi:hypothetical protein
MRRRIFSFAAAISLLLLLFTAALWITGRSRFFQLVITHGNSYWLTRTDRWGFHLERAVGFTPAGTAPTFSQGPNGTYLPYFPMVTSPPFVRLHQLAGVMFASGTTDVTYRADGTPASLADQLFPGGGTFQTGGPTYPFTALHITHAFATIFFSLLPAAWIATRLIRIRTRRIHRANHLCLHCGYNFKGNTSGICPECGTTCIHVAQPRL